MRTALEIALKDFRQRLRDRSAVLLSIVLPLVLTAIFTLLFGSAATPTAFEYAVVDHDDSQVSRSFVDDVLRSLEAQEIAHITVLRDQSEARAGVRSGDYDAAFFFPPEFSAAIEGDDPLDLAVVSSVDSPTGGDVASSIAKSYVDGLNAVRVAVSAVAHGRPGMTPAEIGRVARATVHAEAPVTLADQSATARILDAKTYMAAGMAVFFLMFTVQFGISSLIEERSAGTLSRLLAAPVRRWPILAGKLMTSLGLGLVSVIVLIVGSSVLLGATWGNPMAVGLLVFAGVLAATGITSVVASLARTTEQAGSWQAVVAVSLGLLGGSFFPIQQTGGLMATASLITPHAWFLRGLADLSGGGGATQVLPAVVALLTIAGLTGTFALLRIGKVVAP